MKLHHHILVAAALMATGTAAFSQATIDHNKALAGNVTPGDDAGYPITISQPGHYVLKSNLLVTGNSNGIYVTADNVTIDLNGFTIAGSVTTCTRNATTYDVACPVGAAGSGGIGVHTNAVHSLVVRNGRIQGFRLGLHFTSNSTGEDLMLTGNNVGIQTTVWSSSRGQARLLRSHVSMSETGAHLGAEGLAVMDSVFSRNKSAAISNADAPTSFSNTALVSNAIAFGPGTYGVRGVFMRDNKSNGGATLIAY